MGHWRVSKIRAKWKEAGHVAAILAAGPGWGNPLERAAVAVHWRCRTRRRRDFDNLVSGLKPLLDALVSAGILVDDSTDVLVRIGPLTVEVGAELDETVLTVTEER